MMVSCQLGACCLLSCPQNIATATREARERLQEREQELKSEHERAMSELENRKVCKRCK